MFTNFWNVIKSENEEQEMEFVCNPENRHKCYFYV